MTEDLRELDALSLKTLLKRLRAIQGVTVCPPEIRFTVRVVLDAEVSQEAIDQVVEAKWDYIKQQEQRDQLPFVNVLIGHEEED